MKNGSVTLLPEGLELKESYGFACPKCGAALTLRPSLAMQGFRMNTGHGTCLQCKTFLHLEIAECGEKAVAVPFDDYLAEAKAARGVT